MLINAFITFCNFYLLAHLHWTISPLDKAKWVLIHCIANAFIVCYTAYDMLNYLTCPLCPHTSDNYHAITMVLFLHMYHILCFPCNRLDYVHHIVMCSLLFIPLYEMNREMNAFTNYILFFTCGLPGGIDYYNMVRVYRGTIDKSYEKGINTDLNMWLRSPGILYGAFIAWVHMTEGKMTYYYAIPVILALIWNAQYFAKEVCISYGKTLKHHLTI